jgi:septal ring factor EnvC (AmiA/AmiB activator)
MSAMATMPNHRRTSPVLSGWMIAAALLAGAAGHAAGQVTDNVAALQTEGAAEAETLKRAREAELEAIRRSINLSERRQAELGDEIAAIETDRSRLMAALIETAQRLRATENEIDRIEIRLDRLYANQDGIRESLHRRRAVLMEMLAALQRMGLTPPPAILSRPEDALAAIRGSILAGAVLPQIRVEAEALAADLGELTALAARIGTERDSLRARYEELGEERTRVNLLIESKRSQRGETEAALAAEEQRAAELAARATDLAELIGSLESELESVASAADEAAKASETAPAGQPHESARSRLADTSRIAPAVSFAAAKGLLPLPISGEVLMDYGQNDGLGGRAQGLSITARPGAPVVSPSDGWVVYAGPFRSYGQVLIVNAGDGYHIVLAGMGTVHAALGQFVLAGEPVAVMGASQLASLGDVEHTSAQPTLYVEFRKDGNAIDPNPWWDRHEEEEVRG